MTAGEHMAVAAPPRLRLHFLDGIRGLAALYVLIFHSLTIEVPTSDDSLSEPMSILRAWFGYGHFAVAVFIVLSGFSLAIPLAQRNELFLGRGFRSYLGRRSRRVLPPYYAALVLSLIAIIASSWVPGASTEGRDDALSSGSLFSHLFLVHNWNFDWVYRINGPMWSVATEFQIYFLFPLVLLPLWRRIGAPATVLIAWTIPFIIHFGLPESSNLAWAAPWFVGSFALGVWGAFISFGVDTPARLRARRLPWGPIALGLAVLLIAIIAVDDGWWPLPVLDLIVSVASVVFIVACCLAFVSAADPADRGRGAPSVVLWLNGVLGSKPLVALGAFSYSLYLLQHPFLRLSESLLGSTDLSFEAILWVQLIVGTPLIMLASRVFAEFFEMPFTTGSRVLQRVSARRSSAATTKEPNVIA